MKQFQAILGVLSTPPESDMFLRDGEGSGSGYPTEMTEFSDDEEEIIRNGEGSGSGYSDIGTFVVDSKLLIYSLLVRIKFILKAHDFFFFFFRDFQACGEESRDFRARREDSFICQSTPVFHVLDLLYLGLDVPKVPRRLISVSTSVFFCYITLFPVFISCKYFAY